MPSRQPLHLANSDSLNNMTRTPSTDADRLPPAARRWWSLQDAKARFSEVVRQAHHDGPQHITLHGREAVVIVDADEFKRLQGQRSGELLVEALQASPHPRVDIAPPRAAMPVRAVKL